MNKTAKIAIGVAAFLLLTLPFHYYIGPEGLFPPLNLNTGKFTCHIYFKESWGFENTMLFHKDVVEKCREYNKSRFSTYSDPLKNKLMKDGVVWIEPDTSYSCVNYY